MTYDRASWPLTRTCRFADFPDCRSVAEWQQAIAMESYVRWGGTLAGHRLVINWSGCAFTAETTPVITRVGADTHIRQDDTLAAVFALSVLDRIDAPLRFLRQQSERLLPGGLLLCTFAYWNASGPDVAIGHEVRQRIYDRHAWLKLIEEGRKLGLKTFGEIDWAYHGHTLGDHTLAAWVLTKGSR